MSLGAVRQEDLQRIGRTAGIKTFMDLDFTFSPEQNIIWMEAIVFRASDGGVVWSDAYRSDATIAMLLRTRAAHPQPRRAAEELEHKIEGRPYFGYMVSVGLARIGYNGPTGDIGGADGDDADPRELRRGQRAAVRHLSVGIFFTGAAEAGKNDAQLDDVRRLLLTRS